MEVVFKCLFIKFLEFCTMACFNVECKPITLIALCFTKHLVWVEKQGAIFRDQSKEIQGHWRDIHLNSCFCTHIL